MGVPGTQHLSTLIKVVRGTQNYRATGMISVVFPESTHSTPRAEARGMRRVNTERRFLPRFKNRDLAPSNVSKNDFGDLA